MSDLVEAWVSDGIITPEQAELILVRGDPEVDVPARPGAPDQRSERSSLVVEALAYLGGVIVLVASILLALMYWEDISVGGRAGIVGGAAVAMLLGGLAVPERIGEVGVRLRSVLWLASAGATAGFLAIVGTDVLDWSSEDTFLLVGAGLAGYTATLWTFHRTLVQQAAMFAAFAAVAAALTLQLDVPDEFAGLAVWLVGVVWLLLGQSGRLVPLAAVRVMAAAMLLVGAVSTMPTDAGIVLGLVTTAGIVVLAVTWRDLLLLAVGALGTIQILPMAIDQWFPGRLAAPLALLIVGGMLVASALVISRRSRGSTER